MGMGMYMNGSLTSSLTAIYETIRELEWKLIRINYLKERQSEGYDAENDLIAGHTESNIRICIDKLWSYVKYADGVVSPNPLLNEPTNNMSFAELTKTQGCSTLIWKQSVDLANKEDKVLCLSVGFAICFLNLKQTKDEWCKVPQPLPIISTLNLIERDMPCAIGLLKLDSGVYMIGGQRFPDFNNVYPKSQYPLWSRKLFQALYQRHGSEATCRHTYQLSLTKDSLCISQCSIIPPLNKPIQWPMVVKIGNEIHVIASVPVEVATYDKHVSHHEFLDLQHLRRGWTQVPLDSSLDLTHGPFFITNHILVGQRIFASHAGTTPSYSEFDSKTREWIVHLRPPNKIDNVSEILKFGDAKCALEIQTEELKDPLFVVIALGWYRIEIHATAYLVNSNGEVICCQYLDNLFEGFETPIYGGAGRVIKVDDKDNTMCALFHGYVEEQNLLFISTFTVVPKEFDPTLLSQHCGIGFSVVRDFVTVDVKHSGVYLKEVDPTDEDCISCPLYTVTGCVI